MLAHKYRNRLSAQACECKIFSAGFLLIELLVALAFGLVVVFIAIYFQGSLISMYERIFMRRIALDLAINKFENWDFNKDSVAFNSYAEQETNVSGRSFKVSSGYDSDVDRPIKSAKSRRIVVMWSTCQGKNEKVELGSS